MTPTAAALTRLSLSRRFPQTRVRGLVCSLTLDLIMSSPSANSSALKDIYLTDEGTFFLGGVRLPWTSYHSYTTLYKAGLRQELLL